MGVNGKNHHRRWPRVSVGIIWYLFTFMERMEGWVGQAALGYREICRYDLHDESNPGRSHGSTMNYPLSYSCLTCIQIFWYLENHEANSSTVCKGILHSNCCEHSQNIFGMQINQKEIFKNICNWLLLKLSAVILA